MTNTKAVAEHTKFRQGDRVQVRGCAQDRSVPHWGTIAKDTNGWEAVYVVMDNTKHLNARRYTGYLGTGCYMAYPHEVEKHIPAAKVAMHEGRPVNVEDHGQPKTLAVHDDIQATLDFLHATTQRKWKATTKDVCLEVDGTTTYAGSITISFTEDKA